MQKKNDEKKNCYDFGGAHSDASVLPAVSWYLGRYREISYETNKVPVFTLGLGLNTRLECMAVDRG